MTIAIIDSGIDKSQLKRSEVVKSILIPDSGLVYIDDVDCDINKNTRVGMHGTICASIIEQIHEDIKFVDLRVLDSEGLCSIDQLIIALEWCNKNSIKLINLSLGTANFHDVCKLKPTIDKLLSSGTILVSAHNNMGLRSFPASFPGVFGVRSDLENTLLDKEYTISYRRGYSIENCFVARCSLSRANSFAAPVITGHISKFLDSNTDARFYNILSFLQNGCRKISCHVSAIRKTIPPLHCHILCPIIVFDCNAYNAFLMVLKLLRDNDFSVQALSDKEIECGIIPLNFYALHRISNSVLSTLYHVYQPDIILLCMSRNQYIPIIHEIDAIVRGARDQYSVYIREKRTISCNIDEIYQVICHEFS